MLALAYINSHFQIPFLQSQPSAFLMVTSVTIMAVGFTLPFTPSRHRTLPRVHGAAAALLAAHRHDAVLLRAAHAGGQGVAPAPPVDLSRGLRATVDLLDAIGWMHVRRLARPELSEHLGAGPSPPA